LRFKTLAAVALAVTVALGGILVAEEVKTSDQMSLRVWKVGEDLKCLCPANCAYTVASCNMLHCSFREEVNPQIQDGLEEGLAPTRIVEVLRAKYGAVLRTMPQAEGFGLVGWAMPFFALGIGLAIVPFVVRRLRKSQPDEPQEIAVDAAAVKRYTDQIDKDLDDLV